MVILDAKDKHGQHWGENVEFRLPSSLYEFLTVLDPL